jgi:hypothetical protein
MFNMPSSFGLLTHVRSQARKIPALVPLWRRLKKVAFVARYCIPRLIGFATYPIMGRRAPLRGYYAKTRDFLRHGDGYYTYLDSPSATDETTHHDEPRPERFMAVIPKGASLYECGVIVSPDHRLLADVSWEGYDLISQPLHHPAMYKLCLPPIQHIAGRVAIISSLMPDNYYHWMFDILPRFEIVQKSGLMPDYYVVNTTTQFQKDSLNVLNIPPHRILNPTRNTHIEADELMIPSLIGPVYSMTPQLLACKFLRSTFLQKIKTRKPHRALYITRTDASNRHVINEAEIREEVLDHGFEVISLSNVPLLQQVELFSEAKIVVGPHGAGFTNAVFCQPGCVLIEFMPEGWKIDCFERLARLVGMEYYSIVGMESDTSNGHVSNNDHIVERAALRRLLRQFA